MDWRDEIVNSLTTTSRRIDVLVQFGVVAVFDVVSGLLSPRDLLSGSHLDRRVINCFLYNGDEMGD